jgi:hypothetical protein
VVANAVVCNHARIAFAERTRELATLRVPWFTRAGVGWILIGEIGVLTQPAIPLGWIPGTGSALLVNEAMSGVMFRLPFVIGPRIYALSAAGVLAAFALSVGLGACPSHHVATAAVGDRPTFLSLFVAESLLCSSNDQKSRLDFPPVSLRADFSDRRPVACRLHRLDMVSELKSE